MIKKHWISPYCVLGTEEYSDKQSSQGPCYHGVYSLVLEAAISHKVTQKEIGMSERWRS